MVGLSVVFALGFPFPIMVLVGKILLLAILMIVALDLTLLYRLRTPFNAIRTCEDKLSNGDENQIQLHIENKYPYKTHLEIIDEFPDQLQIRDLVFHVVSEKQSSQHLKYSVRPTKRGVYRFGDLNIFPKTIFGLVKRKITIPLAQEIAVYPSFIQLRKYSFFAINNRLSELGIKKIRKLGVNNEFEQIREYVKGDDFRTVNWKATARKSTLMVNQYQEERSQSIYCLVDKGRLMHMPFNGLSLIDYAINSSLVMSNVAIAKGDKAGLITFSNRIGSLIPASKKTGQMNLILEALYNQKSRLQEPDFPRLYRNIKSKVKQRSLMLLFTNFESVVSLKRHIKSIRAIAKDHLLVTVIFENTELFKTIDKKPVDTEGIYIQTIAEKFAYEKRLIVKELQKYGIQTILTAPENLAINAINKYLEIKARGGL